MRIRSIKPEFWRSDDITGLSMEARLLFIGIWCYVDDNGVGADKLSSIVADLFADDMARNPRETLAMVSRDLETLSRGGQVVRYRDGKRQLLFVTEWDKHQRVDKPSKGHMYPRPPAEIIESARSRASTSRDCRETPAPGAGEQGNRGAGEQGSSVGAVAIRDDAALEAPAKAVAKSKRGERLPDGWVPSEKCIQDQMRKFPHIDLRLEHEKFTNYWNAQSGQRGVKLDWEATWRNWIISADERKKSRTTSGGSTIADKARGWGEVQVDAESK